MFAYCTREPQSLSLLRDEMDTLIERFFGHRAHFPNWQSPQLHRFPTINAWQDDDNIFLEAEMPGMTDKDIEVSVNGQELTIQGERKPLEFDDSVTVHHRERGFGPFSRVVHLPVEVDDANIEAIFHSGVLTITMAKPEVARPRRILVNASEG